LRLSAKSAIVAGLDAPTTVLDLTFASVAPRQNTNVRTGTPGLHSTTSKYPALDTAVNPGAKANRDAFF
jgi:hypothetical protein